MRRLGVLVLVVVLGLVAGCSSGGSSPTKATPTPAPKLLVRGEIIAAGAASTRRDDNDQTLCWTTGNAPLFPSPGPLDDIKAGGQVVVTDASGKTVGIGTLEPGFTTEASAGSGSFPPCEFDFRVTGVPSGSRFYDVKAGTHSVQVPASRIQTPVIRLSS